MDKGEQQFKKYYFALGFILIMLVVLVSWIFIASEQFGSSLYSISLMVFLLFGMLITKWDGLSRLKHTLPHIDKKSVEARLEKINT